MFEEDDEDLELHPDTIPATPAKLRYELADVTLMLFKDIFFSFGEFFDSLSLWFNKLGKHDAAKREADSMQETISFLGAEDES